jgi:protein ImuA
MSDSSPLSRASFRAAEWRPGLSGIAPAYSEIFVSGSEAAGAGMALALAWDRLRAADGPLDGRAWLWVQDRTSLRLSGRPYLPGLPARLRHRLIHVAAGTPEDALFALEEGLRCRELAFVIGEVAGNPRVLDFTASRRLSLAVERHGVPLWLVRLDARRDLSAARMRWSARPASSPSPRWNPQAPGISSWRAELFRARNHPPGEWILRDDADALAAAPPSSTPDSGDLAAPAGDRPLAAG